MKPELLQVLTGDNYEQLILERLRYPGFGVRERVPPFCLPIFADVSIFTRHIYPFSRGRKAFIRRRKRVRDRSLFMPQGGTEEKWGG